jgi:hypothetical protein
MIAFRKLGKSGRTGICREPRHKTCHGRLDCGMHYPDLDRDDWIWRTSMNRVDRYFIRVMVGLLLFLFLMIGLAVSRISDADEGDPTNVPRAANHHRHK